jgi:hypothetical protein
LASQFTLKPEKCRSDVAGFVTQQLSVIPSPS